LIKSTASRTADHPASIPRARETGCLNPDPSTWFTGARISSSSSSSGAVGPGSLNVLDGRGSAADGASSLWRRSVSEGRTGYAR
jgi:hypothetical protein